MGVRVGQPTGAFRAPHGIESADHMSAIENRGDIELRAAYLKRFGKARVCLPSWTLETKKGALPSNVDSVMQQKRRERLMITLKFWYLSSNGLSFGARSTLTRSPLSFGKRSALAALALEIGQIGHCGRRSLQDCRLWLQSQCPAAVCVHAVPGRRNHINFPM
jgi:hypothetical protein